MSDFIRFSLGLVAFSAAVLSLFPAVTMYLESWEKNREHRKYDQISARFAIAALFILGGWMFMFSSALRIIFSFLPNGSQLDELALMISFPLAIFTVKNLFDYAFLNQIRKNEIREEVK